MEVTYEEVKQICAAHKIEIKKIESTTGSFEKKIFFINQEYLVRVSETSMAAEQKKFEMVSAINHTPKILHIGSLQCDASSIFYTILTMVPGIDFVEGFYETTTTQQEQLGPDVASFLDSIHAYNSSDYDIGLYIPIIAQFSGTWRDGHQRYWEYLQQESSQLSLKPESVQIFKKAFQFLQDSSAVLDYQNGPKLLHNDFHPKNILIKQGKFSGVIDWECSQFGEADFELTHLIHWCLYPPKPTINFRPFLRALFQSKPTCTQVPDLAQRLTIYQIEHEIQQIIWQSSEEEPLRIPRLLRWLEGDVEELIEENT